MLEDKSYPEKMLRGLPSLACIYEGFVLSAAFSFDVNAREDGYRELSITWYENEEALDTIMKQTKENGEIQFKAGIAEINRVNLKTILKAHVINGTLKYEKRPTPNNKYHGNLLLSKNALKPISKLIANGLALAASNNIHINKYCINQSST